MVLVGSFLADLGTATVTIRVMEIPAAGVCLRTANADFSHCNRIGDT